MRHEKLEPKTMLLIATYSKIEATKNKEQQAKNISSPIFLRTSTHRI